MFEAQVLHQSRFNFTELLHSAGLERLDEAFLIALQSHDPTLHDLLLTYRHHSSTLSAIEQSDLIIKCSIFLEGFLAAYFDIEEEVAIAQAKTLSHDPISVFKKYFVLRRARKELNKVATFASYPELCQWLQDQLATADLKTADNELSIALLGSQYLNAPEHYAEQIEKLVQWCTYGLVNPDAKQMVSGWSSFHLPERVDYQELVPTISTTVNHITCRSTPAETWRQRDGFKLTDPRMTTRQVHDEVNYCIYCHDHEGDFCSKGFPVKKGDPAQGLKKNALDNILTGCPLEEKISEMNLLKKDGYTLAALATVMIDNPMCPATGHRICNDCMKACIYQKQDPVNIPQIETRVLTDVLALPYGVEIYDLLTRWNPLRNKQWVMKPYNGLKVMIAGMGPAGFTLAHHLLLEGFAVVGIDGLKIEPLPDELLTQPIKHFSSLVESLDERLMAGFGGVAEYGITVRWDKNFLKLIYLSLLRRPYFQVFGGVRFGGTVTVEEAFDLGFDHFVVAVGAGLPKALAIPHSMAPGMRQANDFLMALQLGNAAKATSLTTLQVRLPAIVIGGGLTGVDTATEVQAYYITLVEKVLNRYEELVKEQGEASILSGLDEASRNILEEYLTHGRAVRSERQNASLAKRPPHFIPLIHQWGGVTIAYRRTMQESPAYINNHEELKKAFEEGIFYLEHVEPHAVELDAYGQTQSLVCYKNKTEELRLPARSILVATGTQPNTAYEFEHRGTFKRVNLQYQHYEDHDGQLSLSENITHCKQPEFGAFTSYQQHDHRVSLIGDTHPVFHGSVVKAIASGMRTYPKILDLFKNRLAIRGSDAEYQAFATRMRHSFTSQVTAIERKATDVIEVTIKSPLAAKRFRAGEFYRLQNFETTALHAHDTLLQMEPLAVLPAERTTDSLSFLIHENTATAKLCATLTVGETVNLMGPTGVRVKMPTAPESILIIGNRYSFAFARHVSLALRDLGCTVTYACHLNDDSELYDQDKLTNAVDSLILVTSESMTTALSKQPALLNTLDRIFVVGDSNLLREFQSARHQQLKPLLTKNPLVFGSVYGNMQCMLKGVCAQCLQWQIDPETGLRTKAVFACSWQDQPLEMIDIGHLDERQRQNYLLDYLNQHWIDYLFKQQDVRTV